MEGVRSSVMRATKDLVPGARVFVIGGVAEGRTTVLSDIDILIVIPGNAGVNRMRLYRDILARAMDVYGLPGTRRWSCISLMRMKVNITLSYLKG